MTSDASLGQVLSLLEQARSGRRLTIAAIDGCSGSGKTTLASAIVEEWPAAAIVHVDDFYHPMDLAEMATLGPEDGFHRAFDWQRLRDEVLAPLVAGDSARYRRYDWGADVVGAALTEVSPRGLVVVEGVYALYDELRDYYSAAVFVDTSAEVRRQRCLERAGDEFAAARDRASAERGAAFWVDLWMAAEDWYVERSRPHEWADLVVAGG